MSAHRKDAARSRFVLGLDFGTNSVRALVVRCRDGRECGACVIDYPSGRQGILLDERDHNLARQHPGDFLHGLERSVKGSLQAASRTAGFHPSRVAGIGVAGTGSSPLPVDRHNRPLALHARWAGSLAAYCWLWKDHTSHREAAEITALAAEIRPHFLGKCGGAYSSEWFWSKILHCRRSAPAVFRAAYSWVELADWIPSVLAGIADPRLIHRGVCMAGHKALYSDEWGGLPDQEFLDRLDPALGALLPRLYTKAHDAADCAGRLCDAWAARLGLPSGIPVAVGELDVHYGAIGSGVQEGTLVKVMGTSTCDCAVVRAGRQLADIPGICGIVRGAILPGQWGIEAGQAAVGDIFKWWIEVVGGGGAADYAALAREASRLKPGQSGLLALDWNNGNRTVLADPLLTGLLLGLTLHTTRAEIYRALIEATAFGARVIIERLAEFGVPIKRIVCAGGLAEKNPLLMQIYADVTGRPMFAARSAQACALGAAVAAAVVAGCYPSFAAAQKAMTGLKSRVYRPRVQARRTYERLFGLYRQMHDAFGGLDRAADLSRAMKELLQIKSEAAP
jgi:L-ribulokinase